METIETTDIYRTAFYLYNDGILQDIKFRKHNKKLAYFVIVGNSLNDLDMIYRSGNALVEPMRFREALNQLRDVLFDRLQKYERRYDNDRKKHNRIY